MAGAGVGVGGAVLVQPLNAINTATIQKEKRPMAGTGFIECRMIYKGKIILE